MTSQTGNLTSSERLVSGVLGFALSALALHRGNGAVRAAAGIGAAALLVRAVTGHCAVKATVTDQVPLAEGLKDQLRSVTERARVAEAGLPGSPLHQAKSARVDESVSESFPASDPPASRLPDEPPANAAAKWAAARAAGDMPAG